MMRKIAALLMALLLMASFYVYALLQEDEESKRSDRWVVEGGDALLKAQADVASADPAVLARAMNLPLLLPASLNAGSVMDENYHGYRVRVLSAVAGDISVRGIRPASAAALLRPEGLSFLSTDKTLLNAPLMRAEKDGSAYYYLADEKAAFVIRLPLGPAEEETLSGFTVTNP